VTNAVLILDPRGNVLAASGLPELLGRSDVDASAELSLPGLVTAPNGNDLREALAEAAAARSGSHPRSLPVTPTGGGSSPLPCQLTLHRIGDSFIMGVLTPGAEPGHTDLEVSESILQRIWSGLSEAMALATRGGPDEGPSIVAANAAFGALFNLSPEEARGRPLMDFLAPGDGAAVLDRIRKRVTRAGESLTDLTVVRREAGDPSVVEWELAPVRDRDGVTQALIAVLRDVTAPAPWTPVTRGPDQDPLTGLPNRRQLISRLERSVERALQGHSYAFAVIGIEVEGLRSVERRLGTAVANALLDALVWRIRQALRPGDLIARVGTERLAVLLDHFAPRGGVDDVLHRITHATQDPYSIAGEHIGLRAIGAAGPVWTPEHAPGTAGEVLEALENTLSRARVDTRAMDNRT
jgi:diguanylate cyclase (GGDEF)-like protein/PAS domain S-box-containing protein